MIRRLFARLPRGLLIGLVPGLLVFGASGAHPAYATVVADIVNEDTKCLSQENVGPVIDTCDGTQRQDWKLVNVPNHPNDNLIRNDLTGDCLAPQNTSIGAQVIAVGCDFNGGHASQLWFPIPPVTADGGDVQIANEGDGLVMHPSGCGNTNDLAIFMNVPGQCRADDWRLPSS